MKLPPFALEEFWKKYEFTAPHLLCCSDVESWTLSELLNMADAESKKLWDTLSLGYTEPQGMPMLRHEIARFYSKIDKEQVLTFAGAEEGIYCTMQTVVESGDHVIVVDPCYQSLSDLPQALGAQVTKVPLRFEDQWRLDPERIKNAIRPNTKLIVLNYPHNPTGAVLEKKVFEEIIAIARKSGSYIFCDEVYRYLEVDESKRLPSIADAYEKGISLNVMTKAFGLAGLRIGWVASQDVGIIQKIGSYKLYTSICNSAPSEILALIALRAKDKVLQRNRKILLDNLDILQQFMKRHTKSLAWVPPQGSTMAVIKLLLPIPIDQFALELVENAGVLIMPGTVFGLSGNFFRIGFGRKNMPDVLHLFEQYISTDGHR